MVDARLPAESLASIRIDKLSHRAFRILAGALMWCNGQGTDGSIPARYTKYLHPDGDDPAAFAEIERAGIWTSTDDGYVMHGWSTGLRQSTAAQVAEYREGSRLRQKRYRDRQRDAATSSVDDANVTDSVTRNATREVMADVGSGSSNQSKKTSAYASRNVTRNADSPFCREHPEGTTEPCGACARARVAFAARQSTIPGLGWDCTIDGHKLVIDGTCAVCEFRPAP